MGATIKDIAKIAGVSHSTVSRSLHGSSRISAGTRERIIAIAKELNYTPNLTAQSLKLQRSFTVGVFFTSIMEGTTSNFFHQALKGCNQALLDTPYNFAVKGIEDYEGDYAAVTKSHFDGIVVVSQSEQEDPFIQHLTESDIPYVVINRNVGGGDNLLYNEEEGAYLATKHLIDLGHRSIGFIRGKETFTNAHQRELGFRRALEEAGVLVDESLVMQGDFSMQSGYDSILSLGASSIPSGIFCSCDEMAIGAIKGLQELGIAVPDQCSVIGFDNTPICEFITPRLSSVERPIDSLLYDGMRMILDLMDSPAAEREDRGPRYLHCQVISRESTKMLSIK